jgi:hypothetical protein
MTDSGIRHAKNAYFIAVMTDMTDVQRDTIYLPVYSATSPARFTVQSLYNLT